MVYAVCWEDAAVMRKDRVVLPPGLDFTPDANSAPPAPCSPVPRGFLAQPRFQAEVHEEDMEKILTGKHFAKMLAIADKKEVEIEIAHLEKLEQFNELMQMTSKRKEVALRDASYYQRILETYGERHSSCLARSRCANSLTRSVQSWKVWKSSLRSAGINRRNALL